MHRPQDKKHYTAAMGAGDRVLGCMKWAGRFCHFVSSSSVDKYDFCLKHAGMWHDATISTEPERRLGSTARH